MKVPLTFRIDFDRVKENVDVVQILNHLGDDLFLVLHKKPSNFHYHGYLISNVCAKTFRKRIQEMLTSAGNGAYSVSDKVPDPDRFMSYCMFRPGHPIGKIHVNVDEDELKKIHNSVPKSNSSQKGKELKLEKLLKDILNRYNGDTNVQNIVGFINKYFKENGMVIHKSNITQLALTVYVHLTDDYQFLIRDIIAADDCLSNINANQNHRYEDNDEFVLSNSVSIGPPHRR